jgi:hypothetical protein
MDIAKIVGIIVGVLALIVIVTLLITVPVWLLWNWIAFGIFGLPKLTLLQSLGLVLLTSLLFKGNHVSTKS